MASAATKTGRIIAGLAPLSQTVSLTAISKLRPQHQLASDLLLRHIAAASGTSRRWNSGGFHGLSRDFPWSKPPQNRYSTIVSTTTPPPSNISLMPRLFSTTAEPAGVVTEQGHAIDYDNERIVSPDGRIYVPFEIPKFYGKLKPHIVKRRLDRMRTYTGKKKDIRHSPFRMNLVCTLAAGLTLDDALLQLAFCPKKMAPVVAQVLKNVASTANVQHGLQTSQLEVAECFATQGKHLKRRKIHARGKSGVMRHKHTHFRVVLREIDFKLRIYQAVGKNQKIKWRKRQIHAEEQYAAAKKARDELEELRRKEAEYRKKQEPTDL